MAQEVIGLLFGVQGGSSINGESGKQIVRDLTELVNQINRGQNTMPKVKLAFDTTEAEQAISKLKTELSALEKMGRIKLRGAFENAVEEYKSVYLEEITESEYNFFKAQLVDVSLGADGEIMTLDNARGVKIEEMRAECEVTIVQGFDIVLSDGLSHHFTLDVYDQLKISKLNDRAVAGGTDLPYHADGEVCRYYSQQDIFAINQAMEYLVEYHTTYFNSMKVYLSNIFNVATIMGLKYGDPIPEEHQSEVLKKLLAGESNEEAL